MAALEIKDIAWQRRDAELRRRNRARGFEPWKENALGKVFEENGSHLDPHKPGHILVHRWGMLESRESVFGAGINVAPGDWVRLGYEPKPRDRWRVLGLYDGELVIGGLRNYETHGSTGSTAGGGSSGEAFGPVPQSAISIFRTSGDGESLTVTVQPCIYRYNDRYHRFIGSNLDLTSYVPGTSGMTTAILVYLNMDTGSVAVQTGTTVPTGSQVQYPDLPDNGIPSAFVQLTNGQTAISTSSHITDARPFLGEVNDYTLVPEATDQHQLLVSSQSQDWELGGVGGFGPSEAPVITGDYTLDMNDVNNFVILLTASPTLNFDASTIPSTMVFSFTLFVVQDNTGPHTITWPGSVVWSGGTPPSQSTGAFSTDMYIFYTFDGGTSWFGTQVGASFS